MKYPVYVKNCIDTLERSGHSAFAVGGAVRDSLIGAAPSDWDVTTSATPEEILAVFEDRRAIPTGIKHGTVTVLFDWDEKTYPIEITTFRVDGKYRDNRHPESVSFSKKLTDDLSRRDFTVNAMAYNEKEGIIDCFGGQKDIEKKLIRAVGDPKKRFNEDALRILRAFRFSAQLGFDIEEKTLDAANECANLLKNIARERIGVEIKKLLASQGVVYALEKMTHSGVWGAIFGEYCLDTPDVSVISKLSTLENGNFSIRFAALISELGENEKRELISSLRLSNGEKKLVLRLCALKNFNITENRGELPYCARRFLHMYGDICDSALSILRFWNDFVAFDSFRTAVELEKDQKLCLKISDLAVRGGDILPLCGGKHELVGKVLAELLKRVIEDPSLNEEKSLLDLAERIIEKA